MLICIVHVHVHLSQFLNPKYTVCIAHTMYIYMCTYALSPVLYTNACTCTYTLYLLGSAAADTPVLCDNCHPLSGTEHVPPVPMKVSDVLR